ALLKYFSYNFYQLQSALIILITRSKSSSDIFESLGKQIPFSNNSSETSPPIESYWEKTGCRCIGFHTGRDSIFSSSRASITILGVIVSESMTIALNQKLARSSSISLINEISSISAKPFLYVSKI